MNSQGSLEILGTFQNFRKSLWSKVGIFYSDLNYAKFRTDLYFPKFRNLEILGTFQNFRKSLGSKVGIFYSDLNYAKFRTDLYFT